MAFPTTITTGGTAAYGGATPYLSSAGNVYVIVKDDVTISKFRAFKATDPTSSFSNVGTDPQVTSTNEIKGIATYQVGDTLHVATLDENGSLPNSVDIRYHTFSMSSDSWTLTNETIVANINNSLSLGGAITVAISVRSDGDVIVLYNKAMVANMGSNRKRVGYARRESAVWTVDIVVDNGGATDWYAGGVVIGSSDRMHFFFLDDGADDAYQRCLRSDNTLETFPASFDTSTDSFAETMLKRGISYVSGANTKVRFPYMGVTSGEVHSAKCDSADTPTMSKDSDITGATDGVRAAFTSAFSADGTTLWHTLTDPNSDIYTQSNANDGGWSTPASFYTGTVDKVYTNIYTRSGDIVLAIVFSETDPKYHEKVLTAGDTSLFTCDFECDFGGRSRRR